MILVLRPGATAEERAEVLRELERLGCAGQILETGAGHVVHVSRGRPRRARKLRGLEQVVEVLPTSGPRVRREGWRFFPYHFVNWSAFGVLLLGVLVFLAGQRPPGIGAEVDYAEPAEVVSQPWYLRPPLAFARLLPDSLKWLAWTLLALAAAALLCLPLLDRLGSESRGARLARLGAALCLLACAVLPIWWGAES